MASVTVVSRTNELLDSIDGRPPFTTNTAFIQLFGSNCPAELLPLTIRPNGEKGSRTKNPPFVPATPPNNVIASSRFLKRGTPSSALSITRNPKSSCENSATVIRIFLADSATSISSTRQIRLSTSPPRDRPTLTITPNANAPSSLNCFTVCDLLPNRLDPKGSGFNCLGWHTETSAELTTGQRK